MKKTKRHKRLFRSVLLSILIVLVDLLLQNYFRSLNIGLVNPGISFGVSLSQGGFYSVAPILFLLGVVCYSFYKSKVLDVYLLCMVIGGVGNMIPRILYGNVWDYINITLLGLWINLSDVLISVSMISYILKPNGSKNRI